MKDEWNKRLLGTFPCIKIFFLFFLFYQNISYASFLSWTCRRKIWSGKEIKTIFRRFATATNLAPR